MPLKSVIVIGGGLAGMSSAVALAEAGCRVLLLEKRPHLGGRATSYSLPNGEYVDNCQHVTMGCCTNLDDFYRRVGAADQIHFYDMLYFMDREGRRGTIHASPLPSPFHLAPSFAAFPSLSWKDKRTVGRAMWAIVRGGGSGAVACAVGESTMLEWLRRHAQTEAAIQRFWRVVLVSALDEELDRTSARYGLDVFWKGFLANRRGFEIGVPAVPLGKLYDGCRSAIQRLGGEVRTRAGVRGLRLEGGAIAAVMLDDGGEMAADAYVVAVPHDALPALLPPQVAAREPAFANLRRLRTAPITGVHLWFDRAVMAEPFLTLLERTTQWIFNKSLLYGSGRERGSDEDCPPGGQYLQLVISASYDLVPQSRQEIIALCLQELCDAVPAAREARLVKATVIKEMSATFSPEPGCDRWRPASRSPVGRLYLAGDWTATGWPATMEGAVRSGYLAAEAVLGDAGEPRKVLRPDLPVEGFARMLGGTRGPLDSTFETRFSAREEK